MKSSHLPDNNERVNSNDLTTGQYRKLNDAMFPHVNFLWRLKQRCEELRFPADDPLRIMAANAYDAAWRLSLEIHSRSVRMGSGKRP